MQRTTCRIAGFALAAIAFPATAADDPAATVRDFNAAVTARSMERMTPLFAAGSVQFTLRPAHAGMAASAPAALTGDLKAHWTQVGTLLFAVTKRYARTPTILDTRIDGDLATVWTRIDTETLEQNAREPRRERFGEVYLLVRKDGAWRIAAIADNRGTDRIDVGAPAGAGKP